MLRRGGVLGMKDIRARGKVVNHEDKQALKKAKEAKARKFEFVNK